MVRAIQVRHAMLGLQNGVLRVIFVALAILKVRFLFVVVYVVPFVRPKWQLTHNLSLPHTQNSWTVRLRPPGGPSPPPCGCGSEANFWAYVSRPRWPPA